MSINVSRPISEWRRSASALVECRLRAERGAECTGANFGLRQADRVDHLVDHPDPVRIGPIEIEVGALDDLEVHRAPEPRMIGEWRDRGQVMKALEELEQERLQNRIGRRMGCAQRATGAKDWLISGGACEGADLRDRKARVCGGRVLDRQRATVADAEVADHLQGRGVSCAAHDLIDLQDEICAAQRDRKGCRIGCVALHAARPDQVDGAAVRVHDVGQIHELPRLPNTTTGPTGESADAAQPFGSDLRNGDPT
jgi:hypothetical protein